ncbi:MAG: type II toxin-antitoxin system Phd/YefM family antitoxin [Ekhidna sp.]
MKSFTVTDLRKNIYKIVEETSETNEPVHIYGKKGNAVMVSEEDWKAIQETLYLHQIPGMAKSIIEGMNTPLSETSEDLDW